jgi:DNA-directed RNA polymerase subunit RPC12/RpoP
MNYLIICPHCNLKLGLTKEEIINEKYITCWYCNNLFLNSNYLI